MAGNKTVPLKWGENGPIVGTATIDENGLVMAEIDDEYAHKLGIFKNIDGLSIYTKDEESVDHGGWEDH